MNVRNKKLITIIALAIMIATVIIEFVTGLTMYFINKQSHVDSYVVDGDGNALDTSKVHKMPLNLIYTSPTTMSDESGGVVDELILKGFACNCC